MPTPVFVLQDGAVDELMSVVLVTRMPEVELLGVGIANADCLGEPTVRTTRKLLHWLGRDDVPVGLSAARGVNAFPWEYRPYSMMADLLPILNRGTPPEAAEAGDAEELLIAAVEKCVAAGTKLTVLALCPLTPLVHAWTREPSIKQGIAEIVWMGGTRSGTPSRPPTWQSPSSSRRRSARSSRSPAEPSRGRSSTATARRSSRSPRRFRQPRSTPTS